MTIRYALTRAEIVRSFLQSVGNSPKVRAIILLYSAALGVLSLAVRGAFSRSISVLDATVALAWTAGAIVFKPLWLFIRAKTGERTLTVSPEGIATEIGRLKGEVPWSKVKLVTGMRRNVLIVGVTGSAFYIPSRAFSGPDQQALFMAQVNRWRNAHADWRRR